MLPCFEGVTNADDSQYVPTNCWKDLYQAICEAERFIYITGNGAHEHMISFQTIFIMSDFAALRHTIYAFL